MRMHSLKGSIQVAVLGGNGFIGRSVIHRLSNHNNLRIFSIDKREHGIVLDTKGYKAIVQQIKMDITDKGAIEAFFAANPVDAIIYACGHENPTDGISLTINEDLKSIIGLQNVIESLKVLNITKDEHRPHFIYLSSYSIYGVQKKESIETTKEYPSNAPGMVKLLSEDLVKRYCTSVQVPYCILRLAEVYGRKHAKELAQQEMWSGFVSYYTDKIVRKISPLEVWCPQAEIDFVDINYVTKFISYSLKERLEGVFNVGSGSYIKIQDLVTKLINSYEGTKPQLQLNTRKLKIDSHMDILSLKAHNLVQYDTNYKLDTFIPANIKLRQLEIANNMAILEVFKEPVTLDTTAIGAQESFEARRERRKLAYKQIKEIAGSEFFKINFGKMQERAQELLEEPNKQNIIESSIYTEELQLSNSRVKLIDSNIKEDKPKKKLKNKRKK